MQQVLDWQPSFRCGINSTTCLSDLFSDRLIDIIFLSETKLDSTFTQAQFDAPGYNSFRKDRNCHGGGILAYIRSDLPEMNTNAGPDKVTQILREGTHIHVSRFFPCKD